MQWKWEIKYAVAMIFSLVGAACWVLAIVERDPIWGPPLLLAGSILLTNTAIMLEIGNGNKSD
jgi:hypothetical protein